MQRVKFTPSVLTQYSRLQGYTIGLYKEIEETSGHSIGMHATGGFYLA
ncbi:MAG: hypothetical protein CM1200mP30_33350 [Pseudomonadota bacterium]|nr:MAG: hypothetical protein CM1200mP30_33350 [Pseudomonadota bacterium]